MSQSLPCLRAAVVRIALLAAQGLAQAALVQGLRSAQPQAAQAQRLRFALAQA